MSHTMGKALKRSLTQLRLAPFQSLSGEMARTGEIESRWRPVRVVDVGGGPYVQLSHAVPGLASSLSPLAR